MQKVTLLVAPGEPVRQKYPRSSTTLVVPVADVIVDPWAVTVFVCTPLAPF
jgi:hypothetical protein